MTPLLRCPPRPVCPSVDTFPPVKDARQITQADSNVHVFSNTLMKAPSLVEALVWTLEGIFSKLVHRARIKEPF